MLRDKLVEIALGWEEKYGVAPSITGAISEYDAAMLVGMSDKEYSDFMVMGGRTAVSRGCDFIYKNVRYQIKGTRPSGKKGCKVTNVGKAKNYEWDKLIWVSYDREYVIEEVWEWDVEDYKKAFSSKDRTSAKDIRKGKSLYSRK